jgi:hypothetical protein
VPQDAREAIENFEKARDQLIYYEPTNEGAEAEIALRHSRIQVAVMEWAMFEGLDLKSAAASYLAGAEKNAIAAREDAKSVKHATWWMAGATVVAATVALASLVLALVTWLSRSPKP